MVFMIMVGGKFLCMSVVASRNLMHKAGLHAGFVPAKVILGDLG
jgi:hypothetical protein